MGESPRVTTMEVRNWGCRGWDKERVTLNESHTATGQCELTLAAWLKVIRIEVCYIRFKQNTTHRFAISVYNATSYQRGNQAIFPSSTQGASDELVT